MADKLNPRVFFIEGRFKIKAKNKNNNIEETVKTIDNEIKSIVKHTAYKTDFLEHKTISINKTSAISLTNGKYAQFQFQAYFKQKDNTKFLSIHNIPNEFVTNLTNEIINTIEKEFEIN